jgi:hypothetical protein
MQICTIPKIFSSQKREAVQVTAGPADILRDKNFKKKLWI